MDTKPFVDKLAKRNIIINLNLTHDGLTVEHASRLTAAERDKIKSLRGELIERLKRPILDQVLEEFGAGLVTTDDGKTEMRRHNDQQMLLYSPKKNLSFRTAVCYVDGACEPNPGRAAIGIRITFPGSDKTPVEIAQRIPDATNNEAEYQAVIKALLVCAEMKAERIAIYSDSKLIVNQVNGEWACNEERLQQLVDRIKTLKTCFKKTMFTWVPREQNTDADRLSKEGLK